MGLVLETHSVDQGSRLGPFWPVRIWAGFPKPWIVEAIVGEMGVMSETR